MLTLDGLQIQLDGFEMAADFSVDPGAKVAIIGPSGAGKSTLLNAIAGFVTPATGRVLWQERDITSDDPGVRPVSMVFQDNNLFPHMTAFQNVAIGIRPSMRLNTDEQARVTKALDRVGLAGMGHRKPGALSGGQQSRVVLARVLVQGRPLVLLDEPFSALGPALREEMLDLVAGLIVDAGATLLMVTHDPEDALRIAGQTIFVDSAAAIGPEDTKKLLSNPPAAMRAYLGR
ncbi:MAG: ATP-binding cassette domain-containing protein [Marinosulfonomonas sp.]|nr:ATP-binding cassette domain-containing protein [Marinosulfonomonas sp.]